MGMLLFSESFGRSKRIRSFINNGVANVTTSSLAVAFDEPQWRWWKADGALSTAGINPVCLFYKETRVVAECRLSIPMEFYHFFRSLHGMEAQVTGFTLQKVDKRFYFSYGYRTPNDKGAITLWYWVPSTLPSWIRRYI